MGWARDGDCLHTTLQGWRCVVEAPMERGDWWRWQAQPPKGAGQRWRTLGGREASRQSAMASAQRAVDTARHQARMSTFGAAGFTDEEYQAWSGFGLSCAEAEAARTRGVTPVAVAAMEPAARAVWVRRLRVELRAAEAK